MVLHHATKQSIVFIQVVRLALQHPGDWMSTDFWISLEPFPLLLNPSWNTHGLCRGGDTKLVYILDRFRTGTTYRIIEYVFERIV